MTRSFLKILIYLLINGSHTGHYLSPASTNSYSETFIKQGYEIVEFHDKNTTVSKYFSIDSKIWCAPLIWKLSHFNSETKVIVNSPEWEITLHLHEFDESWMRYILGRSSDRIIMISNFLRFHFLMRTNLMNFDKKEKKN